MSGALRGPEGAVAAPKAVRLDFTSGAPRLGIASMGGGIGLPPGFGGGLEVPSTAGPTVPGLAPAAPAVAGLPAPPPMATGAGMPAGPLPAGCAGNGLQTILSRDCMRHLSAVPPSIGGTVAVPLPAPPGVDAPVAAPASPVVAAPLAEPAPPAGLRCRVTDQQGRSNLLQVADSDSCINEALGSAGVAKGVFAVTLSDSFGHVVAVYCSSKGDGERPSCKLAQ